MESTLVSKTSPDSFARTPLWEHLLVVERRYLVPGKVGSSEMHVVISERHGSEKVGVYVAERSSPETLSGCAVRAVEQEARLPWCLVEGSEGEYESFMEAHRVAWGLWEQLRAQRAES